MSEAASCESLPKLQNMFEEVLAAYSFTHYSAISLKNALGSSEPHTLARKGFEDFDARYWVKRYHSDDPCVRRILQYTRPFAWSDEKPKVSTKKTQTMWGEAGDVGMREGFVVKVAGPNGESVMVRMASNEPNFDPLVRPLLESIAVVFVTVALRLEEGMVNLTDHGVLSRREAECLFWVKEGKTDWEIAAILSISAATVYKHIASAKEKLAVTTRSRAAVMASELGLLDCQW